MFPLDERTNTCAFFGNCERCGAKLSNLFYIKDGRKLCYWCYEEELRGESLADIKVVMRGEAKM